MTPSATCFQLIITYDWKPEVTPARRQYHVDKIRALLTKGVPGLLELRIGPRSLGHPAETASWDHGAVMVFSHEQDYISFGSTKAHDDVAFELVADLERIQYIGFTG